MVKVYVTDGLYGPMVLEVRGLRGGREWLGRAIQDNLAYLPDGSLSVYWSETGIPDSLRKRVCLVQA
jgi:hypothetical protein